MPPTFMSTGAAAAVGWLVPPPVASGVPPLGEELVDVVSTSVTLPGELGSLIKSGRAPEGLPGAVR